MYNGKYLKCDNLSINLPDFEETLKDTEESRLKMKDKMIQLDYVKLNKLYDSFVPQKEISVDQTYLSAPSTSNVTPESSLQMCQAQSIDFELQLQHQKEKNACDISWKSKMEKLNDEKVSLAFQFDSLLKERENIKLEYQTLFNSIKTTQAQHQWEVNELIENVNQKTYYVDVRSKNQHLLMIIYELKVKLKFVEKGKNVDIKFDRFAVLRKLICVRPMNKNKDLKSKIVPEIEVRKDLLKQVTSCSSPKIEQVKSNTNVIARGMHRVVKIGSQIPIAKPNMLSSNSIGVESSSSVSRPESKSTNLKKSVFLNTKSKRTSKEFKKHQNSGSFVSNKSDTSNLNV
ncbi:hypothetical protein Tco_1384605 [Tanacetum coccineum]